MRRHPAYIIFMNIMVLLLLIGIGLMIYGSTQQGPLPRPTLTVPRQMYHG